MSWSQQDTSFKKLQNKRITTSTGKGIDEEKGASSLELYLPDVKTDLIPGTPPGATTSVLSYTGAIGQTLAVDTSVPGNLTWFATSGYGNTTSANDGSAGSESLRLGDWISDKYDAFGTVSGAGYEVKVYDKDSNLITKADPSDWLFDYQTGILVFNSASTTYGAVTSTGPFRVAGYRYIGSKGIISASYGGVGYTSYTTGDLLVGAGSTFIKLNVGSNDYVLTADNTTPSGLKWAGSTGSLTGSGTSSYVPIFTGTSGTALTDSIMSQIGNIMVVSGSIKALTKSFIIPHPIFPETKKLEHGSLEGPEHGAYQRGTGKGIEKVEIKLPDYWSYLVEKDYTVLLTPKCNHNLYVASQNPDSFTVRRIGSNIFSKKYIEFDYFLIGERKDIKIITEQDR
jgi:hypothetical protein